MKRIPTCNTWEDLFNDAIINVSEDDLSDDIVDKYSKIASISVSREPNGEAFYPENTEEISNTLDFDSNLKYVTVSLQLHSDSPTSHPEIKDANQVLMASRYALKNPHKIGEDRARFTGNQMSATLFCYCFKYLFEIKIYEVQRMQQNLVSVV